MAILAGFPAANTISPSVRITETDNSLALPPISTHTAGIIGFCSKGPINLPTAVSSVRDLHTTFGYPHPDVSDPYLIYAGEQFLLIADTLYVVRVADESPVSPTQAITASTAVPSSGSIAGIFSLPPAPGSPTLGGVPAYLIPNNQNAGNAAWSAYYFRWRLNGNLSSKTLVLLPGTYTATQLCDPNFSLGLMAQLDPDVDGVQFTTYTAVGDAVPNTRLMFESVWAYGPDASLEIVSVQNALYGGAQNAIDHNGSTWSANSVVTWNPSTTAPNGNIMNPLGFGTGMTQAKVAGLNNKYPSGPYISVGNYDLSATGLFLQVVMEGTDNVLIDDVVQTIYFTDLEANVNISTIVTEINSQAMGFFAYSLAGTLVLATDTFGEDSKIYVKPTSTAGAIFGFPNNTYVGTSPEGITGDADSYTEALVFGCASTSVGCANAGTTFTLEADSPGIEGNNTQVVIDNNANNGTFTVNVYSNGAGVEQWGGLTKNPNSSYYVESFLSLVSNYVRVVDNTSNPASPVAGTYSLIGGTDGIPSDPDDQDSLIIGTDVGMTGMYAISDPEQVDIDLIACPGRASTDVIVALLNLCQSVRQDCFAIIDPPFGLTVTEIVAWQNGAHPSNLVRFNSDFGALYWPWLNYTDTTNQINVWVPPSGSMLAVYANNDNIGAPWMPPAGITRGVVPNINGVFQQPSLEERDLMYGNFNAVNPIIQIPDISDFVAFGQKTLQRLPTALNRVNVRRMLLYVEKNIKRNARVLLFEPNDPTLWAQFIQLASTVLDEVQSKRGLTSYAVQCDAVLNPPDVIDQNQLNALISIQPEYAVEFIFINFSLYNTGTFAVGSASQF